MLAVILTLSPKLYPHTAGAHRCTTQSLWAFGRWQWNGRKLTLMISPSAWVHGMNSLPATFLLVSLRPCTNTASPGVRAPFPEFETKFSRGRGARPITREINLHLHFVLGAIDAQIGCVKRLIQQRTKRTIRCCGIMLACETHALYGQHTCAIQMANDGQQT